MTLKHLSITKPDFTAKHYRFYHVPIDSYLLKAVLADTPSIELRQLCSFGQINGRQKPKPIAAWSKINDYETCLNFQRAFRHHYQNQALLDTEFGLRQRQKAINNKLTENGNI